MKLFLSVKWYLFKEQLKVIRNYYRKGSFALLDLIFHLLYLFQNPYTISRKHLEKKYTNPHQYGETPLTTFDLFIQKIKPHSRDTFLELGSGRAKCCFWLSSFYPCKVVGVEQIGRFVFFSKLLQKLFRLSNLSFKKADFLEEELLSKASIIYLYGTCMENEEIAKLLKQFKKLKKGCKIISVSFSLVEFEKKSFCLQETFQASFPWGTANVYLQEKV